MKNCQRVTWFSQKHGKAWTLNILHPGKGNVAYLTTERNHFGLDQGLVNVYYKGLDSKYFRLCEPHSLLSGFNAAAVVWKAATDNILTGEHGCVAVKLDARTLEFDFHGVFMGHDVALSFDFVQPFENVKAILTLRNMQKEVVGWMCPWAVACHPLAYWPLV